MTSNITIHTLDLLDGVNPLGGIESIVSRKISIALNKPVAHAPLENEETYQDSDLMFIAEKQIIDLRKSSEAVSSNYAHCVLKGLHKSPQIGNEILSSYIDCLITPYGCIGKSHFACCDLNFPVITVLDNKTSENKTDSRSIIVKNYLDAAGSEYVNQTKINNTKKEITNE